MSNIIQSPAAVNDPLQSLHDIHVPAYPHWWPLAPGWWIVIGLTAFITAVAIFLLWRKHHWQQKILAEVDHIIMQKDPEISSQLAGLSSILRRVALRRFSHTRVASLYGQDWVEFLKTNSSFKHSDLAMLQPLSNEIYQQKTDSKPLTMDDPLVQFVRSWIRENLI